MSISYCKHGICHGEFCGECLVEKDREIAFLRTRILNLESENKRLSSELSTANNILNVYGKPDMMTEYVWSKINEEEDEKEKRRNEAH